MNFFNTLLIICCSTHSLTAALYEPKKHERLLLDVQQKALDLGLFIDSYGNLKVSGQYVRLRNALSKLVIEKKIPLMGLIDILQALEFANTKHGTISQPRKDKEKTPYISHPMGVAEHIVVDGGVTDPEIIMAALLHDTVEDTKTTFEELEDNFGKTVADYVREVSDDKSLAKHERKRLQIVNAPHKSPGASIIKLGDFLYNLTDMNLNPPLDEKDGVLTEWPAERINVYFAWAMQVIDGLPYKNPGLCQAIALVVAQR